jgi:cell division protein FtsQ
LDGGGRFVSALKWGQGKTGAAGPALFGMPLSFDHFVLPRLLRRPVRVLARLGGGEFQAPRFCATIMSAVLIASSCAYGAYLSGDTDEIWFCRRPDQGGRQPRNIRDRHSGQAGT